ncbi:hypothetical protein [Streptomyces sp. NPDC002564]|uniref:hypothetical protein n=1 Tax=Streptomyces sp. NPDC002564 TaxID=3364649 RepID=UPI0036C12A4E
MKWGNTQLTWDEVSLRAASAVCAAQLPVAGLVAYVLSLDDDTYGAAGGPAIGLACALVFAPVLLPVLGLIHSAVLTLPACWLGRWAAPRVGHGPEWAWSLAGLPVVGAAWAGFFAALGAPFAGSALWIAASGLAPAIGVAYCRRRQERLGRPLRKVWILSGLGSLGLSVAVVALAALAAAAGLLKEYEPPRPSPDRLAGVWRGDGDVELRLLEGGRAELAGCGAGAGRGFGGGGLSGGASPLTGTWTVGVDSVLDRPAVVLGGSGAGSGNGSRGDDPEDGLGDGLGGGGDGGGDLACGMDRAWVIGGSEDDLELFVSEGDPDAPEVEILRKAG